MQTRPNAFGMRRYFSANYVFPSSKSSEDQKKKSSPKIEEFLSPKSSENQKKKSLPQFETKFSPNLLDLCGLTGLFCLINQRSNLDGGTLNLNGGTLNFDGKMLTIDGNALPRIPPTI